MVYACFVAKMSKMAFTRFGGQFQFEKSMLGRLDNSGAGIILANHLSLSNSGNEGKTDAVFIKNI